jgi:hypothetical protein
VAVGCGIAVAVGGIAVGLACVGVETSVRAAGLPGEAQAASSRLKHNILIKVVFMIVSY